LELSGNDPLIVREDASLPLATKAAIWGSMINAGQNCIGIKRIFVHQSVFEKFKNLLLTEIKKLKCGPGQDWETNIGPLRREKELIHCEELIVDALAKGGKVLFGGKRVPLPHPGHFFEPTLLTDITPNMKIWSEDFFGPMALLDSFSSDEQAIEKANSIPLGLSGAIFSRNMKAAERCASALDGGMVTINEVIWPVALPMFPFGGKKSSGFGRMRGLEGLREMVNVKTVFARSSNGWFRPHYFVPSNKYGSKIVKWMSLFYK